MSEIEIKETLEELAMIQEYEMEMEENNLEEEMYDHNPYTGERTYHKFQNQNDISDLYPLND